MEDMNTQIQGYESMTEGTTSLEITKGEQLSDKALKASIRPWVPSLLAQAFKLSQTSGNENVQLGAIKLLLAKVLPDLRAMDLTGELNADGSRPQIGLFINLGSGFVPANLKSVATSIGSITEQPKEIQSLGVAPESQKDDHSNL